VKIGLLLTIVLGVMQIFSARAEAQTVVTLTQKNAAGTAVSIDTVRPLLLSEAVDLALKQASAFKNSQLAEQIAAEDIKQSKTAFLPRLDAKPNYIFTSPSFGSTRPRPPSFLGANAINEIQGLVVASGELDTSGRLKATLERNRALLASAHAGTEIAKRDLIQGVNDAYFTLALSTAKRRGAESNLRAADDFEAATKLLLDAGEVAPVDLVRARLQSAARRDELEQAKTDESVNADSLKLLTGLSFGEAVATVDLLAETPADGDIERFSDVAIATRPEFMQFEAEAKAASEDIKIAKADRRPQLTYSVGAGVITESLAATHLRNTMGVQATVGVTIPLFDWGQARSRETQAKLRLQQTENTKALAERQFAQAFFSSRTQAISARNRIKQIGAAITDAESNLSASTARYRAGEATIIEVTDAQNILIAQKAALYQALFDYQTAKSRLMRATGQ
jgi:outer membrane protein TolC